MGMKIVTGYTGTPHVTAEADGALNAGIFGSGRYVLNLGDAFAYEAYSSNLIRIKNGYALNQGRLIELSNNEYEEVTIENGQQGMKRCDIIAIRYSKDRSTGVESASLVVIKGTSGDDFLVPESVQGNIINGDFVDEMPLYQVRLNGINIVAIEKMFELKDSFTDMTGIRSYGSLAEVGAEASNTISEIMSMMDYKSTLMINTVGDMQLHQSLPSTAAGILIMEKSSSTNKRGVAFFTKLQTGETWTNSYLNGSFIGWQKMIRESDMPVIQSGVYSVQIVSSSKTDHTIYFDKTFASVPAVQISKAFSAQFPESKAYNVDMIIKSVSKTKMVVTVWSNSGSTPFDIHWTAIAK